MDAWQEASDALSGIHVANDMAVLSLNSSQGIADSRIADHIDSTARGV